MENYEDILLDWDDLDDWNDWDNDGEFVAEDVLALQLSDYYTFLKKDPDFCIATFSEQDFAFNNLIATDYYIIKGISETGEPIEHVLTIRLRYEAVDTRLVVDDYEVVQEFFVHFTVDGLDNFSEIKLHLGKCHNGLNQIQLDEITSIVEEILTLLSSNYLKKPFR